MIRLIINEINKVKISKIVFTYLLIIISLILINKYSENDIFEMSYYLIPFIGVFLSILFSGSICFEIESGTLRYYLTKPFKRYKIYLSKFLTMLIYVFISYLIIVIVSSIIGNNINIKYIYKYFIYMIPNIFMCSFILYLSTKLKSHVLVSCISILTFCFSLIVSQVLFGINISFIEYTFLPYLDYSIFNDKVMLLEMNKELNINLSIYKGIIIDSIYFLLFIILGIVRFNKKDIKN